MSTEVMSQNHYNLETAGVFEDNYGASEISQSNFDNEGWVNVGFEDNISDVSSDTVASISSRKRRVRRAIEEVKKMDSGYNAILDKRGKKVLEFYETTCIPGIKIRDAITGIRDEYRIGSVYEDLYFKVSYCGNGGKGQILYFADPEQCERHFNTDISTESKEFWTEKRDDALKFIKN